jgi:TDG/mug DNA glycosylase family protein
MGGEEIDMSEVRSFGPVWAEDARVLILGTAPSLASLEQGFNYAHPRNAFWPIMFDLLGEAPTEIIEEKKRMLVRHKIALWDVVHSCIRPGSLDGDIRDARANDVPALIEKLPELRMVLFNGGTALRLYKRLLPPLEVDWALMPSTSPANTMRYEEKRAAWAAHIPPKEGL